MSLFTDCVPTPLLAQWRMAVICAEREPYKQVILEGRTVLAIQRLLDEQSREKDGENA